MLQKYHMDDISHDSDIKTTTLVLAISEEERSQALLSKALNVDTILCLICAETEEVKRTLQHKLLNSAPPETTIYFSYCIHSGDYAYKRFYLLESGIVAKQMLISEVIQKLPNNKITIDITSMSSSDLYALLYDLKQNRYEDIEIIYSEPGVYKYDDFLFKKYIPFKGDKQGKELTGIKKDNSFEDYSIILLGFDSDLTAWVNQTLDPSKYSLVNGLPGYLPKNKEISILNSIDTFKNRKRVYYAAANNPYKVYNTLRAILRDERAQEDQIFTIIPLGTKPMLLAACVLALEEDNVRLWVVSNNKCNHDASKGVGRIWKYTPIPLEAIK